jgi:hypothetical protein
MGIDRQASAAEIRQRDEILDDDRCEEDAHEGDPPTY